MKYYFVLIFLILKISPALSQDSFSTRLNSRLTIDGVKCSGTEMTMSFFEGKMREFICSPDEWVIYISGVEPFFAKFHELTTVQGENDYFNIIPVIPVSAKIRWYLRKYGIKEEWGGGPRVHRKI